MSDTTTTPPAPTIITDIQELPITLEFKDAAGNAASAPAGVTPAWSVNDDTVGTLTVAADGLSATLASTGKLGTVQVQVTDGTITGVLSVEVQASAAVSLAVNAGAPTNKA